ncbi:hypothetical protein [Alteribacter populi]|uniref:hypothetical protein n=1 Tax=Alteribacter populi TaxID=2011011 RepID=UPI000BBB270D|nr:hypothetical protein [Alteribacter populi]
MKMVLIFTISIIIIRILYYRYVPLFGVECVKLDDIRNQESMVILDLRDFQTAHQSPIQDAVNIPMAHVNRHYVEVGEKSVCLVASSMVDIHLIGRFLKKKRINVGGFALINEANQQLCKKGREIHEL